MSLFTSREDDMLMSGTHVALLSNLGILAKSQAHASLLHSTLRTAGNTHVASHAPANPHRVIQRSAVSDIDREAERKYGERMTALQRKRAKRGDSRQEAEHLKRMSQARANGGIEGEDEDDVMIDGVPYSGSSLSKSLTPGAFAALRLKVFQGQRLLKSQAVGTEHGESFEERYGIPAHATVAQAVGVKTIRAAVKPAKPVNTIAQGFARINGLLKSMGLEAGYGTDSATLTGGSAIRKQSLPAKPVAKPLSPDELLKAASTLLHHGRIDTQTAARVQSEVNLTGKVSPALMKTLSEACK